MDTKERAEYLQEYINKELDSLTKNLEGKEISEETRAELATVYGSELVNRLFGKRDYTTMPELSSLATSSLKTRALLVGELKIWERLMKGVLISKNRAVVETAEKFKDKTDSLYDELHETLSKQNAKYLNSVQKTQADLLKLLEDEKKEVNEICKKGEKLRTTDKDSVKANIQEHTELITRIIKGSVEEKINRAYKDVPESEYHRKEFVINQIYCLAYFFLGGALVSAGFFLMKLFS